MRFLYLTFYLTAMLIISTNRAYSDEIFIPAGTNDNQAGIDGGEEDSDLSGPASLAYLGDKLLILDALNHRILSAEADDKIGIYKNDLSGSPKDIVIVEDSVFIWDEGPKKLESKSNKLSSVDSSSNLGKFAASKFSQFGLWDDNIQESGRPSSFISSKAVSLTLPSANNSSVTISANRDAPNSVKLSIFQRSTGDQCSISIRRNSPYVSAVPLEIDNNNNLYLLVLNLLEDSNPIKVRGSIRRYNLSCDFNSEYVIPFELMDENPKATLPSRFVAISKNGKVAFLIRMPTGTKVIELPISHSSSDIETDKIYLYSILGSPTENKTGDDIVKRAQEYATEEWQLSKKNYRPDEESACNPPDKTWKRPVRLDGKIGRDIVGLPYNWGGGDTLQAFRRKIRDNSPAGNVCTSRSTNTVRNDAAGIDCSGLASRAWDLKGRDDKELKVGTSDLAKFGVDRKISQLEPGDLINKAGSHVRIFSELTNTGLVRIIESSIDCGGACDRYLSLAHLYGYAGLHKK
ncbi:hypothetical protein BROC_00073 [Candidatus Brocadiaceae bacterium]|nr:hypothetical protein BROC_00073 [Candidatus Brocadiaceae bacterium]